MYTVLQNVSFPQWQDVLGNVISPLYISERRGPVGRNPPGKKWGVRGAEPLWNFLILRIKNKRSYYINPEVTEGHFIQEFREEAIPRGG